MLRLSIQFRQALARLTLPVLAVAAFSLMLLAKADTLLADRLRAALGDSLAPLYAAIATPAEILHAAAGNAARALTVMQDNTELREENEKLRKWQTIALALDAENAALKAQLHFVPDTAPRFVTARVVADTGGIYTRSMLVAIGPNRFVAKGQIVLDQSGLVGRVTELGTRSARILLITDLNSRVPVELATSHVHAIMVGDNSDRPRLLFLPQGFHPQEGERIVTSGQARVFPRDLPVGTVQLGAGGAVEVLPEASLDQLDLVRIVDYGLSGLVPPEAPLPTGAAPQAPPTPAPKPQ